MNRKKEKHITSIGRAECQLLRESLNSDLKLLAKKYGLSLEVGSASYSHTGKEATFKLAALVLSGCDPNDPDAKTKAEFEAHAVGHPVYVNGSYTTGTPPLLIKKEHFGWEFIFRGEIMQFIGYSPQSRKYPILGRKRDGKVFKYTPSVLRKLAEEELKKKEAAR